MKQLIEEAGLDIDDVRYYLSSMMASRLLAYAEDPEGLIRMIWSKHLEDELYDMEERFMRDMDDRFQRKLTDEAKLRQLMHDIQREKAKRIREERRF